MMYQVRCQYCDVRLFDASGMPTIGRAVGIDIQIKCPRCRRVQRLTLTLMGQPNQAQGRRQVA